MPSEELHRAPDARRIQTAGAPRDVLHPLRAETENGCFISLNDEKGQPYVVVEFQ